MYGDGNGGGGGVGLRMGGVFGWPMAGGNLGGAWCGSETQGPFSSIPTLYW